MANSAAPLLHIFGITDYLIPLVLEDLSDSDPARGHEARTDHRSPGTWGTCSHTGSRVCAC